MIKDKSEMECNFLYVAPKDVKDLQTRVIRNRVGTETQDSLNIKLNVAEREIKKANGLSWINEVMINDSKEDFIKKATVHLMYSMYRIK